MSQTIIDGYPLGEHLITFNETHGHIPNVDDVGTIGVKKKKYSFHKKESVANFEGLIFTTEKVLPKESVHNVFVTTCYAMNCYQHFPHEKTCC